MNAGDIVLLLVVLAFAWNLGAHYTGATMGMPYAARSASLWPALTIVAVFAFIGASTVSGRVEETVGLHLIVESQVSVVTAIVIVASAGALTTLFNTLRLPTSTIQILVFCVVGAAVAAHLAVRWSTLGELAIVWVAAPVVALGLGFGLTRALDGLVPREAAARQARRQLELAGSGGDRSQGRLRRWFPGAALRPSAELRREAESELPGRPAAAAATLRLLPLVLILVGVAASFVMGGNDVANATGALLLAHLFAAGPAGMIGGAAMAVGALTWGRRILQRVAFDVVEMDLAMASAAQGVQALVVVLAVSQGLFTSMNQALIAAMAGTGLARGRDTVKRAQLFGILRGWLVGPAAGFALAFAAEMLARALTA
ncbi:MAG TPA: inorganic phosphate transporter [Trueperaceae bacterium]|nr:inorganic phosphate transporter [Trueperaceae bacterium]